MSTSTLVQAHQQTNPDAVNVSGPDALRLHLKALGLQPGDQLLLAYGDGNTRTLLATVTDDYLLTAQKCIKDKASGEAKNYKAVGFQHYSYEQLRELARIQNLFYLPSQQTQGRSTHHRPELAPAYLYAEIDDRPLDEQRQFWQQFTRDTGLAVHLAYTGGKSLHAYILLSEQPSWDEWQALQQFLCAYAQSDIALERSHQPMRLPGFPRIKGDEEREVCIVQSCDRRYSVEVVRQSLEASWPHPQVFTAERWEIFKSLSTLENNPLLKLPEGIESRLDAFSLPLDELQQALKLKPSSDTYTDAKTAQYGGDNPWVDFLDNTLMPAVERLPLEQQFGLSGYDHQFKSQSGKLVGNSPWSPTNGSGTTFQINSAGEWFCHASEKSSQSVKQYLQEVWFGRTGRSLSGPDFIEFCTKLASALGIAVPKFERKATDINEFKARKARAKLDERAQWFAKVATIAGSAEHDRAVIAKAFQQQALLDGDPIVGIFSALHIPSDKRILIALDGQKMTRKTSQALKSVVDTCRARGWSCVIYVPTRVLARAETQELIKDLQQYSVCTIDQYLSLSDDKRPEHPIIVCCPESAWKLQEMKFQVVCMDEVNEVMPRAQSGILGNHPKQSRDVISQQLADAQAVVIAQEKLYRASLRAVQRWGRFDANQVEVIKRKRAHTDMAVRLYLDIMEDFGEAGTAFSTWFDGIVRSLEAGKRVIIPCGSESKARAIHRVLRALFPDKRGQVLDGKWTPGKIRTSFADKPSDFAPDKTLDWMIFTPVFNSGVSIEGTYFDVQYEYIHSFEAYSAASQRGERCRDAIKGERIKERHIYIANRGLSAYPDPSVFTVEYNRKLLTKDDPTEAIALAKQLGCEAVIDSIDEDNPEDWLELPEFLAIRAFETYFKTELLTQEFEANDWDVQTARLDNAAAEKWSHVFYTHNQNIIEQKARTLAKARAVHKDGDEVSGPIEALKHLKWSLTDLLGDYSGVKDAKWIESWVIAAGETGLQQVRIRLLVNMANEQPDQWAAIRRMFALSAIAKTATCEAIIPELPCSHREFEQAKLLINCPHLHGFISGTIAKWTNKGDEVKAIAQYARANALALAKLSAHNQRIHGLQFTDKTADIKCTHKLLSMVGLEGHCLGRQPTGDRLWEYRLKTADDIQAKLDEIYSEADNGPIRPHDTERQLLRAQTDDEVYQALDSVLKGKATALAAEWLEVERGLMGKFNPSNTSVRNNSITEVLDECQIYELLDKISACPTWQQVLDVAKTYAQNVKQAAWDWLRDNNPVEWQRLWDQKVEAAA